MTKTLTEQWRKGTLPEGGYYIKGAFDDDIYISHLDYEIEEDKRLPVEEVLAPVPSYDEFKQLVSKTEQLEKKLEIATKALKKFKEQERDYLDYGIDKDGNKIYLYPNRVATKALKEMEGVK